MTLYRIALVLVAFYAAFKGLSYLDICGWCSLWPTCGVTRCVIVEWVAVWLFVRSTREQKAGA